MGILRQGLRFPLASGYYIGLGRVGAEAAIYGGGVAAATAAAYSLSRE